MQDRGGQVIGVSEVKVHPSYDKANNDIALLKLANPLKFNDKIKPIALASQEPPTGVPVIASGWGHTYKGGSTPKVLQYNTFMALTNAECKRRRPSTTDSVICLAHAAGNGLCFGDSGGPAIYKNQLVGVANYMIDGCANTNPDGFASVAYHINWLRNNSN